MQRKDFKESEKPFSTAELMSSLSRRHVLPFVNLKQHNEFIESLNEHYKNYNFQTPEEAKALGNSFSLQIHSVNFKRLAFEIIDSLRLLPLDINQLIVDYFSPSNHSLKTVLEEVQKNIVKYRNYLKETSCGVSDYNLLYTWKEACQALLNGNKTFKNTRDTTLYSNGSKCLQGGSIQEGTEMYALNWIILTSISQIFNNAQSPKVFSKHNVFEYTSIVRDKYLTETDREKAEDFDYSLWCFVQFIMYDHLVNTNNTIPFTFHLTRNDHERRYKLQCIVENIIPLLESESSPSKEKGELAKAALIRAIAESYFTQESDIQLFFNQVIAPLIYDIDLIDNKAFQQLLVNMRKTLNSFLIESQSTSLLELPSNLPSAPQQNSKTPTPSNQPIYLYEHFNKKEIVFQFNNEKVCQHFLTECKLEKNLVPNKFFKNCFTLPFSETKSGQIAVDFGNETALSQFINTFKIKKFGKDKELNSGQTREQYNIGCSRYRGDGVKINHFSNTGKTFHQGKTLIFEKHHPIFKNSHDPKCLKIAGDDNIMLVNDPKEKGFPLLKKKKSSWF